MSPKRKPKPEEEVLPMPTEAPIGERLYETIGEGDMKIIIGPHEGFVDTLGLPPHLATVLHNILYRRRVYNYTQAARHPQEVAGAIQELYQLDAQKLMEALYRYEQEVEGG